ncbi:MAG: alpha/beta hydrolase [Saprospiraceae bacterium]|nr:alpha/beta hydrolase [Saprospiraceae bacterium]
MKNKQLAFYWVVIVAMCGMPFFIFCQKDSTSGSFASFDGTKIYYETYGAGRPVLLIHGFTGDGTSWKKSVLFQELRAHGYMPVLVDMRGNGRSDKPHEAAAYASDAEARDLIALINHLHFKSYDAIGYSRGSIILARLMVFDPRLGKGVMGGMGADFTNPDWPRRVLFYHVLAGDTIVESMQPMLDRIEHSGMDRVALSLQQKEQPYTSEITLGKLEHKVLVISGDEDFDNGSSKALSEMIPRCIYKTVPGKHGGTQLTRPFSDEVMMFLSK